MVKSVKNFWEYGPGRMVLAAFCAHSVSISIGIVQGYSAILLPQLEASNEIPMTSDQSSWIASFGAVTNPIGSIISGLLAEYFGRKRSLQISSIPFIIGSLCLAFANKISWLSSFGAVTNPIGSIISGLLAEYFGRKRSLQISSIPFIIGSLCLAFANNIGWLYAGRLITGMAAGMSTACYTYVGEISTPQHRGILQSLGPMCASFGILLTYILGYFIKWTLVAMISIAFAVFTIIAVHFLPESPPYLYQIGKITESFDSYLWLRRNNALAQKEIDNHQNQADVNVKKSDKSFKELYLSVTTIKPFVILTILFLLQELSGIYTLLYYAVNFFEQTNLDLDNYIASIIVGAVRFLMSIVTALLLNRYGRKILCIISSSGMAVTMLAMAIYIKYYEINSNETRTFAIFPLLCVMFNVVFSMIGMLPIPWVLVGELFPLEVRPIMSGIVICLAQIFIFACVKIYPYMNDTIQFSGTLMTFLVASIIAAIFSKICLIETKNRSLQEIEDTFRGKSKNITKNNNNMDGIDNKAFTMSPENATINNSDLV